MRALEARQQASREQSAREEADHRKDDETPSRPPWLANKTRKAPWK